MKRSFIAAIIALACACVSCTSPEEKLTTLLLIEALDEPAEFQVLSWNVKEEITLQTEVERLASQYQFNLAHLEPSYQTVVNALRKKDAARKKMEELRAEGHYAPSNEQFDAYYNEQEAYYKYISTRRKNDQDFIDMLDEYVSSFADADTRVTFTIYDLHYEYQVFGHTMLRFHALSKFNEDGEIVFFQPDVDSYSDRQWFGSQISIPDYREVEQEYRGKQKLNEDEWERFKKTSYRLNPNAMLSLLEKVE